MFNLPTKEKCDEIVQNSEAFYKSEKIIEGQNVVIYDYRLASITDFVKNDAFELRGLTFVQQSDGSWNRYLLLNKFFNINQTEGWMYDEVKDKKITRIQNKEDGSIISFIKFSNGKIRAKSKMSFDSEQAVLAQKIFDKDKNLQSFVEQCYQEDKTPIFELVGCSNQIVVNYDEDRLILLQIRRNFKGDYLGDYDLNSLRKRGIDVTKSFEIDEFGSNPLDKLLELKEIVKDDIEGWVVTFEDSQMAKIKTSKYLELHGLIGPDAFRENLLIQSILNETIDDVLSALQEGYKKEKVLKITERVTSLFNHYVVELEELYNIFIKDYKGNKRDFAIQNKKHKLFSLIMQLTKRPKRIEEKDFENIVKEYIAKKTSKLGDAKEFLKSI